MPDDLPTKFSPAQMAEFERQAADEEAFERLTTLYARDHGRLHHLDSAVFQWAASKTDAELIALGFTDRAGFQYNYDLCLMVEQGPRAKDAIN